MLGPKQKSGPNRIETIAKKGAKRSNIVAILVQNMGQNTHFSKNWGQKLGFAETGGQKDRVGLKMGGKKIEQAPKTGGKRAEHTRTKGATIRLPR